VGPARARSATLRTAARLSAAELVALVEATVLLAAARLVIVLLPFRWLAARLGAHMHESPAESDGDDERSLRRVRWALGAVSRRAPWRCLCLEQAVAATVMLRRRRLPSTLYLGVARAGERAGVEAHAWVRSGTFFVTGGEARARFTVVSTFASLTSA
jgi:hypothetical protein